MANLNRVFLIGVVSLPVTHKKVSHGISKADIPIVVNSTEKSRDGSIIQKRTYMHITAWKKLADDCYKYLKVGKQVHIEAHISTMSYTVAGANKPITVYTIIADYVQFLGKKSEDEPELDVPVSEDQWELQEPPEAVRL